MHRVLQIFCITASIAVICTSCLGWPEAPPQPQELVRTFDQRKLNAISVAIHQARPGAHLPTTKRHAHSAQQKRTENNTDCLTAFRREDTPKSLPTLHQQSYNKHQQIDRVFNRTFDTTLYRIVVVFADARPTISLLFPILSWGATFFAKLGKYQTKTQTKLPT